MDLPVVANKKEIANPDNHWFIHSCPYLWIYPGYAFESR
jgi:hypothetical protein